MLQVYVPNMPTCQILYQKSCYNVIHYSDHAIQNAFMHELSEYQTPRNLHIYITGVKLAAMWKWKTFLKLWSSGFYWSFHLYKIQSPWRCNLHPLPKHQNKPIVLHIIETKKTITWITSTMKTCTENYFFFGGGGGRYLYSGKNNLHPSPVEKP